MKTDLLNIAIAFMESLSFPIRIGYKLDKGNLEFKKDPDMPLTIASARFFVEKQDILKPNDPINAYYRKCVIFYSYATELVLNKSDHQHHKYVKSILLHELVHYLQPFIKGDSQTTHINNVNDKLKRDDEFQAYLVMALYYFDYRLNSLPQDENEQRAIINRFNNEFPHP